MSEEEDILQEEKTKREEAREKQFVEDIRFIMATEQGKRYFRNLFERFPVFQAPMMRDSRIHFWNGVKNVMFSIYDDLVKAAKDDTIKMLYYMEEI